MDAREEVPHSDTVSAQYVVVEEGLIAKLFPLIVEPSKVPPEPDDHQFILPTGVVPVKTPAVEGHKDAGVATTDGGFGIPTVTVTDILEGLEHIDDNQLILILPLPTVKPEVYITFVVPVGVTQLLPPPPPP